MMAKGGLRRIPPFAVEDERNEGADLRDNLSATPRSDNARAIEDRI
ncbi:hypothetical protein USDA257_c43940 [Sinorhizobium fredii USDA 257]|jgi:hypothetical protein|uniref:Uncharacterized protein n=1 Tax=Sinorhizobium fredii (strain USDA 257) TaxID=1185652 RepID=I3XAM6_SINF2|nr:hypothetical protein USDA257_c43940 [Sinorhizobium fredii USDA 257]